MKIHIVGASGAGATTLGLTLSQKLGFPYFDSDDYYWVKTDPPFRVRREADQRNMQILADLSVYKSWILGGSVLSWSDHWLCAFDLVVFLYIPKEIRMSRLQKREEQRYGSKLFEDPDLQINHAGFMEWAEGYDAGTVKSSRTLEAHRNWLNKLSCQVLEILGDTSVQERTDRVVETITNMGLPTHQGNENAT